MAPDQCQCCDAWRAKMKVTLSGIITENFLNGPISKVKEYSWQLPLKVDFPNIYHSEMYGDIPHFCEITNKPHKDFEWEFFNALRDILGCPVSPILVALVTFIESDLPIREIWKGNRLELTKSGPGWVTSITPVPRSPDLWGLANLHVDELFGCIYTFFGYYRAKCMISTISFAGSEGENVLEILHNCILENDGCNYGPGRVAYYLFSEDVYERDAENYLMWDGYDKLCVSSLDLIMKDICLLQDKYDIGRVFKGLNTRLCVSHILSSKYIDTGLFEEIKELGDPYTFENQLKILDLYAKYR